MVKLRAWHLGTRPRGIRPAVLLVSAASVLALGTGGIALAGGLAGGTQIRGCYQPGSNPATLKVLTSAKATCPKHYTSLNWNRTGPQGPPGPAGLSTGDYAGSHTQTPLPGNSVAVTVLQAKPVTVAGSYYVTASITVGVDAGDYAACLAGPGGLGDSLAETGPAAATAFQVLSVTDVLTLTAGQTPSIACASAATSSTTAFYNGTMSAVLVSNSTGTSASVTGSPALPRRLHLLRRG